MPLHQEINANLSTSLTTARRVFHGRGKAFQGYESLNIEWYPPYFFVQNFGEALDEPLRACLNAIFNDFDVIQAVLIQSRIWPDFVTEVLFERQVLCERQSTETENIKSTELPISMWTPLSDKICCEVALGKNRNTGVFLDMRAGWHWVQEFSKDKNVLNLFSYTGVFSLFALEGGAKNVDNMDMAANVLKIAQRNHQKNDLHDGKTAFFKRDILKAARWFERREPYDLIIIDPPPYQKKAFRGWNDYLKLLNYCRHCLAPKGAIFACLNNPQVSVDEFRTDLERCFPEATAITQIATADEIKEQDANKGLKTLCVQF